MSRHHVRIFELPFPKDDPRSKARGAARARPVEVSGFDIEADGVDAARIEALRRAVDDFKWSVRSSAHQDQATILVYVWPRATLAAAAW